MEQPSTKKALFKRCEIKIGSQGLLLLIDLKVLVMMTSLQTFCFDCLRPPDVDGIKHFEKDDQAAKC